jgi:FkbM family methyltransferase
MNLRTLIRKGLQHFGYDIVKLKFLSSRARQTARLFDQHRISLVFDVGANIGQYAQSLREQGYRGRIVSCEPVSSAFASLRQRAAGDSQWECLRCAVGSSEGEARINIAGNIQSSSLLDMLPEHVEAAPLSGYVATEQTPLTTIDRLALQYASPEESIFLKTDTQGFDLQVLEAARSTLLQVRGLELEMS